MGSIQPRRDVCRQIEMEEEEIVVESGGRMRTWGDTGGEQIRRKIMAGSWAQLATRRRDMQRKARPGDPRAAEDAGGGALEEAGGGECNPT